jgi:hypothetical protein
MFKSNAEVGFYPCLQTYQGNHYCISSSSIYLVQKEQQNVHQNFQKYAAAIVARKIQCKCDESTSAL